jgi:hypothetical protein
VSEHRNDDEERNRTQERMDEEGTTDRPVDVDWEEPEATPHEGEEGHEPA